MKDSRLTYIASSPIFGYYYLLGILIINFIFSLYDNNIFKTIYILNIYIVTVILFFPVLLIANSILTNIFFKVIDKYIHHISGYIMLHSVLIYISVFILYGSSYFTKITIKDQILIYLFNLISTHIQYKWLKNNYYNT